MYSRILKVVGVQNHSFESTEEKAIPYHTIAFMPDIDILEAGVGTYAFTGSHSTVVVMSPELVHSLGSRINTEDQKIDDANLHQVSDPEIRYSDGYLLRGNTIIGILNPEALQLEQEGEGMVLNIENISEVEK